VNPRAGRTITSTTWQVHHGYPERLRRVVFFDTEQHCRLVFLTSHFGISAKTVPVGSNRDFLS